MFYFDEEKACSYPIGSIHSSVSGGNYRVFNGFAEAPIAELWMFHVEHMAVSGCEAEASSLPTPPVYRKKDLCQYPKCKKRGRGINPSLAEPYPAPP
jgi:hypothetical protein